VRQGGGHEASVEVKEGAGTNLKDLARGVSPQMALTIAASVLFAGLTVAFLVHARRTTSSPPPSRRVVKADNPRALRRRRIGR
jgi:hypothetical protein